MTDQAPSTQILLSQIENWWTRIEMRLENGTVWLSQLQMAEPFQTFKQNVGLHIQNVFHDRELEEAEASAVKEYLTTAGSKRGKIV
jgi:hypothetical protein